MTAFINVFNNACILSMYCVLAMGQDACIQLKTRVTMPDPALLELLYFFIFSKQLMIVFIHLFYIFIGVQLLYNIVLVSVVQKSKSAVCILISPLFFGFPSHLGHHRALSRVPCSAQYVLISYLFYTYFIHNPPEQEVATHSSILGWRISCTVQFMGLQRVRHD